MIFKRLLLESNEGTKNIELHKKTLIYSMKNSVGKSSILRLLFFGLGYPIPSTNKLNFSKIKVNVYFEENGKEYHTERQDDNIAIFESNTQIFEGILPYDELSAQAIIWNIESPELLENLLGVIYMDQDKGWTLLNRGKVIGNIHFNIRDLLIGLSNQADDLISMVEQQKRLKAISNNLKRIINLQNITPPTEEYNTDILLRDSKKQDKLDNLKLEKKSLESRIKKLMHYRSENNTLKKYILGMHLMIENPWDTNNPILVNESNLLNFTDNTNLLTAQIATLKQELSSIKKQIARIEADLNDSASNLLGNDDTIINTTIAALKKMNINYDSLSDYKKDIEKDLKHLNSKINEYFKNDAPLVEKTTNWIHHFACKLDIYDIVSKTDNYLFTNDIKSLSGTQYYKVVICFKLAYIKVIEHELDIKLPIIWDSPGGREVTSINLNKVIEILNEDFANNQIILASIYNTYALKDIKCFELKDKVFE
jgi:chaperonin cofactor prefoldin